MQNFLQNAANILTATLSAVSHSSSSAWACLCILYETLAISLFTSFSAFIFPLNADIWSSLSTQTNWLSINFRPMLPANDTKCDYYQKFQTAWFGYIQKKLLKFLVVNIMLECNRQDNVMKIPYHLIHRFYVILKTRLSKMYLKLAMY